MKKTKITALFVAFCMILSSLCVYAQDTSSVYTPNQQKSIIKAYAHNIADNFYYGIDDDELLFAVICKAIDEGKVDIEKSIKAMVDVLDDKYSQYYSPEEYNSMVDNFKGEFAGIGVVFSKDSKDGLFTVNSVMENSAALEAGILEGDKIIAINGVEITGYEIENVRNLIIGEENTPVTVRIRRANKEVDLVLTRKKVSVSNISTKMIDEDIAYLEIAQFASNTTNEVKEYVNKIQKDKVKKLIIDVRNNPGGDIDAAVGIANIFASAGLIAQIKSKNNEKPLEIRSDNYNAPKLDIVLIINENSASASEFLAVALKGKLNIKIMGTTSFGKGSIQTLIRTVTGSGIKYTVGEFFSKNGERVHTVGVTPDIEVENEYIPVKEEEFTKIDLGKTDEFGKDGDMTLALEERLDALGYMENAPDAVFDEETQTAVRALQALLGYETTGIPGFYEYLFLNDLNYDFDKVIDRQLEEAISYLRR